MTQKLFREILSFQIFASLEGFKHPFLLENCAKLPQYSISIPFKLPPMATSTGDVDQVRQIVVMKFCFEIFFHSKTFIRF